MSGTGSSRGSRAGQRTWQRSWLFGVSFAVAVCLMPIGVFRGLDSLGFGEVEVALDVVHAVEADLEPIREATERARSASRRRPWQVAFLGDSMVVSYAAPRRVPARLQETIRRRARTQAGRAAGIPAIRVHSVAEPGMGSFDYYFVADLVRDAEPDQVILPFNLTSLSDGWRGTFARPELAGWIAPARIPSALMLPLDWIGLTADRLIWYVALTRSGWREPWHWLQRQQARLAHARTSLSMQLGALVGSNSDVRFAQAKLQDATARKVMARRPRLTAVGLLERLGPALSGRGVDDPTFRVLGAAIRIFRDAGIEVLVYSNPTNMQNVAEQGVANPAGLAHTLRALEETVRENGGHYLELHDLLPDDGFRDPAGHLATHPERVDGPLALAEALAPAVIDAARRRQSRQSIRAGQR